MTLTLPTPRIIEAESAPALRWGVVGVGIAESFVSALHAHTPQRAVAVTSLRPERASAFAAKHGIATVHPSVDALVADPNIDAVYVATPHPLHHEQALAAIAHGKHVLIEKPIAMSAVEAKAMTDAGRSAGVLVMEAMWTRYLPQLDIVRQVIAGGLIGDVQFVQADFGFVAPPDPTHRLWNPELGGGAMLDAGVYPVSFASSVLGPPSAIHAVGTTSLVTMLPIEAQVMGTMGRLKVLSPFFGPTGVEVTVGQFDTAESATWRDERWPGMYDAMCGEAIAFASYVAEKRTESPLHPHAEVVAVMATIDEVRAQLSAAATPKGA